MHWLLIPMMLGLVAVSAGTVITQREVRAAIEHVPSNQDKTQHYGAFLTQMKRLESSIHTYQAQNNWVAPPPGVLGFESALASVGYSFTLPIYTIGLTWNLGASDGTHIALCANSPTPLPASATKVFNRAMSELSWEQADCSGLGPYTAGFKVPLLPPPPPPEDLIGGSDAVIEDTPAAGPSGESAEEPVADECAGALEGNKKLRTKYAANIQPQLRKLTSAIHEYQAGHAGGALLPGEVRTHTRLSEVGYKFSIPQYDDMAWTLGSASSSQVQLCVTSPGPMVRYACEGLVRARGQMGWGRSACAQPNSVGMFIPLLKGSALEQAQRDALRDALNL